jgi:hypothetical protein
LRKRSAIGLGVRALQRQHGEALGPPPLGEALQPLDEDEPLGRGDIRRRAIEDGDRLKIGPVLEEDAAIAAAERMLRVRRNREAERRQARTRQVERGDGQDKVVDGANECLPRASVRCDTCLPLSLKPSQPRVKAVPVSMLARRT